MEHEPTEQEIDQLEYDSMVKKLTKMVERGVITQSEMDDKVAEMDWERGQ